MVAVCIELENSGGGRGLGVKIKSSGPGQSVKKGLSQLVFLVSFFFVFVFVPVGKWVILRLMMSQELKHFQRDAVKGAFLSY